MSTKFSGRQPKHPTGPMRHQVCFKLSDEDLRSLDGLLQIEKSRTPTISRFRVTFGDVLRTLIRAEARRASPAQPRNEQTP
jgi:hypothetical protein